MVRKLAYALKTAIRRGHRAWPSAALIGCLALSAGFPAPGQAQFAPFASLEPCLEPHPTIDAVVSRLESLGWETLDNLPEQRRQALTWGYVARYFAGDSGGETISSVYRMQLKTVDGLAAKKDIDSSKTRFLAKPSDTMAVLWRTAPAGRIEIECRLSAGPGTMQQIRAEAGMPSNSGSDFTRLPRNDQSEDGAYRFVDIVLLNGTSLSEAVSSPVMVDAIIDTYQSFRSQE